MKSFRNLDTALDFKLWNIMPYFSIDKVCGSRDGFLAKVSCSKLNYDLHDQTIEIRN